MKVYEMTGHGNVTDMRVIQVDEVNYCQIEPS